MTFRRYKQLFAMKLVIYEIVIICFIEMLHRFLMACQVSRTKIKIIENIIHRFKKFILRKQLLSINREKKICLIY